MFEGFESRRVQTSEAEIFLRIGGSGPPVLLLHGYPQTHVVWRLIAPALSRQFTVACPDLRGYGDSSRPRSDDAHVCYSKRVMAQDMIEIMDKLGFGRFAVVGHDRGARVAYRMALDHQHRVSHLVFLDVVPTAETWNRIDMTRALRGFHWQFLAQPEPLPERMIGDDPGFFLEWLLRAWAAPGFVFDGEALEAYRKAFRNPEVIHATCEDYRAGATIDYLQDQEDKRIGRRITCPVLALWGSADAMGKPGATFLDIWRAWAEDVSGTLLSCGHFLPEEAPDAVLEHLQPFLQRLGAEKRS